MIRKAFKMKLKPGCTKEYKKRHDEIWPELIKLLKDAGICDYAIYLDEETNSLFSIQNLREDNKVDEIASQRIMQKWWDYMADLMITNPDNSPVITELELMFDLKE